MALDPCPTTGTGPSRFVEDYQVTYVNVSATTAQPHSAVGQLQEQVRLFLNGEIKQLTYPAWEPDGSATVQFTIKNLTWLINTITAVNNAHFQLAKMMAEGYKMPQHAFKIHVRHQTPAHTTFAIFAGVVDETKGLCGELTMRNEEFEDFKNLLTFKKGAETVVPEVKAVKFEDNGLQL